MGMQSARECNQTSSRCRVALTEHTSRAHVSSGGCHERFSHCSRLRVPAGARLFICSFLLHFFRPTCRGRNRHSFLSQTRARGGALAPGSGGDGGGVSREIPRVSFSQGAHSFYRTNVTPFLFLRRSHIRG